MIAIIPDILRDVINAKLDVAISEVPEAEKDRDVLYNQLLLIFDETGEVPDFKLQRRG